MVIILGLGIYNLVGETNYLSREVGKLRLELGSLKVENSFFADKIDYFKHPENLLKDLKSKFNYREAEEKLMIIMPK